MQLCTTKAPSYEGAFVVYARTRFDQECGCSVIVPTEFGSSLSFK